MVLQDHPACQHLDRGEVSIDTLSITLDLTAILDYATTSGYLVWNQVQDPLSNDSFFVWSSFQKLLAHIFGPSIEPEQDFRTGRNFFKYSLPLKNKAGFVAFGGNNVVVDYTGKNQVKPQRMQIYLSGEGCRMVSDWVFVHQVLTGMDEHNPKITRVDIAYDDHEGARDVDYAADSYRAGLFAGNGRPPKGQRIDDMGSGDGCTFYVGSRDSGRYLRVYEKGKQLGDKESAWVRWEVELSSKQYDIPLCVLIRSRAYLAGSYPCLDWISRAKLIIETSKRREFIELNHLIAHGRRAYGTLINYLMARKGQTAEQVINQLIRDGVPGRLTWATTEHQEPPGPLRHSAINPHLYTPTTPIGGIQYDQ